LKKTVGLIAGWVHAAHYGITRYGCQPSGMEIRWKSYAFSPFAGIPAPDDLVALMVRIMEIF
jgi:hypothetical protein